MNKHQKIICGITAVIIILMMLYPPFIFHGDKIGTVVGYHFISTTGYGSVNVPQLLVQLLAAVILGGIGLLALKDKQ